MEAAQVVLACPALIVSDICCGFGLRAGGGLRA